MGSNLESLSPDLIVGATSNGSACCVCKTPLAQYLLTANHVLEPNGDMVVWTGDNKLGAGLKHDGTRGLKRSDNTNGGPGFLDAALVEIQMEGAYSNSLAYPWSDATTDWDLLPPLDSVLILGKFGAVWARFEKEIAPLSITHKGRRHGRLLAFKFDVGVTHPGDSGGPVFAMPECRLVAMHLGVLPNPPGADLALGLPIQDALNTLADVVPGLTLRP